MAAGGLCYVATKYQLDGKATVLHNMLLVADCLADGWRHPLAHDGHRLTHRIEVVPSIVQPNLVDPERADDLLITVEPWLSIRLIIMILPIIGSDRGRAALV